MPTKIVASKVKFVSANLLYQTLIVNLWLLSSSQRSPRVVQVWLSTWLQRAEFKKVQTDFFLWKWRIQMENDFKAVSKTLPKVYTVGKREAFWKLQSTSEQFSIFTQNSLKYSRRTKIFNLACETLTQIDWSSRKLSDANHCQQCRLGSKFYLNLRIILDSVTWVNGVPWMNAKWSWKKNRWISEEIKKTKVCNWFLQTSSILNDKKWIKCICKKSELHLGTTIIRSMAAQGGHG